MPRIREPEGDTWNGGFLDAIALGQVDGHEILRKFGMNNDVPATGSEEMWPLGTARVLPSAAAVVSVTSSSTADDEVAVGTGAWTLKIEGLDSDYLEISETVSLDGTVAVTTTATFFRINRMYCVTAGTGGINAGNITATIGGNAQAYIEAGEGQTHQTHYTVPAGKYFVIRQYILGVGRMAGSTDCHILGQIKLEGADTSWQSISDIYLWNGGHHYNDAGATVIPPKTELRQIITSTATTQAYSIVAGYLVRAEKL